jgi:hypothetical protein
VLFSSLKIILVSHAHQTIGLLKKNIFFLFSYIVFEKKKLSDEIRVGAYFQVSTVKSDETGNARRIYSDDQLFFVLFKHLYTRKN